MDISLIPYESGVYLIRNYKLNKTYIGVSSNMHDRIKYHLWSLQNKQHGNPEMQHDWNLDSTCWVCSVVELTTDPSREGYWIVHYKSNKTGYNKLLTNISDDLKFKIRAEKRKKEFDLYNKYFKKKK